MKFYLKFVLILALISPQLVFAEVSLNPLFADHMVVQRETEIPVWGWADAFEKITVKASWGEQSKTVADQNGNWKVMLETPKAGGPFKITVKGKNEIVIDDVLSGEVWLCTGQSNMDFALEKFLRDARDPKHQPLVEFIRKEVAEANDNQLRHIEVLQNTSVYDKVETFTGQWVSAQANDVKKISATAYFFAKELRKELNVPIGLVECSWGGSKIQPWISEEAFMADENFKEFFVANRKEVKENIKNWGQRPETPDGKKPKSNPLKDKQVPATLYNGMLNAIIPYAIKGAIWYQGESNAVNMPNDYEAMLSLMINSWRADWNQGDFSFYWAQLAACKRKNDTADKGWATVNDQLRRTLKVPNTGMAVLYDIGEPKDIHPHNKMDAGKRLALWALKKDYNINIETFSGPLYKTKTIVDNKIEIEFSEFGTGLMVANKNLTDKPKPVNEPLKWFEILGEDGLWKPAEAKISSSNKIEVWSNLVKNPKEVRYAWSGNPEGANLYNKEGLPAAVFSTEE